MQLIAIMPKPVSLACDCSTQELLLETFIMVSYDMNLPTSLSETTDRGELSLIFLILHIKEWPIDGCC